MIPIEIKINSIKQENYSKEENDQLLRSELDLIEEERDLALLRIVSY